MYNMRNIKVIKKPLVRHMHIGWSFLKWCRIRKRDDRTVHETNYILSSVGEHKNLLVIVSFTIASFYLGNQVFWGVCKQDYVTNQVVFLLAILQ